MNETIQVIKASGETEPFSEEKVRSSLKRAGVSSELVERILNKLKPKLYEGITTKEIYDNVFGLLKELESHFASKYNLKNAIMELGPTGYPFEKFVAKVLKQEGYVVEVNQIVQGNCVSHEIDVIAQKEKDRFMIECKFHNQPGFKVNIKTALYVYARFLDVQKNDFQQGWLVTNTKITPDVIAYAQCVGLKVVSWEYPAEANLRVLVEKSGLNPITALLSLNENQKKGLLEAGIVTCRDLIEGKVEFLPPQVLEKAKIEAQKICGVNHEKRSIL